MTTIATHTEVVVLGAPRAQPVIVDQRTVAAINDHRPIAVTAPVAVVAQAVVQQTIAGVSAVAGVQGPPGTGSDKTYTHTQNTPSAAWSITHNLGKRPSVTIVDSGGNEVIGEVEHVSANACTVRFSAPFGGQAFLN